MTSRTSKMRLFHHPMSFNARRAVMTALHLGLDVELVLVDLAKGEQRSPEFLAKNVSGKVPVLEDDGFFLAESHAIQQYLADATPAGDAIYPTERKARAEVNRWLFWSAHQLSPSVSVLNWERVVKGVIGLGAPDPALEKRGEVLVGDTFKALEAHLAGREWVAADRLTIADIAIATPLMTAVPARLPLEDFPRISGWFERLKALDAWKKTELGAQKRPG